MHIRLVKSFGFEAAHWLPSFPDDHKCRRMHGHSFRVDVVVEGEVPMERGYLIDYGEIGAALEPLRQQLDHRCLNEVEGLENPTSEMLSKWIWDHHAARQAGRRSGQGCRNLLDMRRTRPTRLVPCGCGRSDGGARNHAQR